MNYSFDKIQGPLQSRRENFEELVAQLLTVETGAERVDGSGGDAGIDCFVRTTDNAVIIFQAKYFLTRLTTSQRRQILRSLETARRTHQVTRWVLCIPINPTPSEREWFESLTKDGPILEWWGETKIRTLVAKYPEIAKSFFLDESLVYELKAFREEVAGTIAALRASRFFDGKASDSVVREYLERASSIGELLIEDAPLLTMPEQVFIGLDFTELHTYMSSDTRFVLSTPAVDFYIQNSPYSLYLLPGAAVELTLFMSWLMPHDFDQYVDSLGHDDNPLRVFVNLFEQDPSNNATHHAYNLAIEYLRSLKVPPSFNTRKLRSVLESGLLKPCPDDIPFTRENADFETFFQRLLRGRGIVKDERFRRAKTIDALNVAFLRTYEVKTGRPVRMISTDNILYTASREYFGGRSFVRNSAEFAYFIHSAIYRQQEESGSVEIDAAKLIIAAKELDCRLHMTNATREPFTTNQSELRSLMQSFQDFAPLYRNILRPVDEMIESGLVALSTIYFHDMLELYTILKREAELVASFRSWWDEMSRELTAIDDVIRQQYGTEQTIDSIGLGPHYNRQPTR
jgi:hypothetical protein